MSLHPSKKNYASRISFKTFVQKMIFCILIRWFYDLWQCFALENKWITWYDQEKQRTENLLRIASLPKVMIKPVQFICFFMHQHFSTFCALSIIIFLYLLFKLIYDVDLIDAIIPLFFIEKQEKVAIIINCCTTS